MHPVRAVWLGPDRDGNASAIARARLPRSDVKGAYQLLARLAPEGVRHVHPNNYEAILNALVRRMADEASNEVATPFAFAVYGLDRGEEETGRRIETTLDAQIRDGLLEEIAELDRRYRLVEQARRPGRRRNVASETHGISRVRPHGRVDREGNREARRRRPCRRTSRRARPHLGVLETAAVVVPQTWRVAGRPSISGQNHSVASAVTRPELRISLAQEQTKTCQSDSKYSSLGVLEWVCGMPRCVISCRRGRGARCRRSVWHRLPERVSAGPPQNWRIRA